MIHWQTVSWGGFLFIIHTVVSVFLFGIAIILHYHVGYSGHVLVELLRYPDFLGMLFIGAFLPHLKPLKDDYIVIQFLQLLLFIGFGGAQWYFFGRFYDFVTKPHPPRYKGDRFKL